jgi:arylsulfatase A-like enzyme
MSIRTPWSLTAPLALLLVLVGCAERRPAAPDVVLIDLESVRVDHLSHTGYPRPTAIRLDGFREGAVLFTHARATSSDSGASTASLLGLSNGRPTLAERLRAEGWATLGLSHHPDIGAAGGFDRGFDRFESAVGPVEDHPDAGAMVDWLREWLASDPPVPFFLYLHPMNAGGPYRVPAERRAVLLGRRPNELLPYGGPLMRAAQMPGRRRALERIGEAQVRSLVEQYDTALRYSLDRVADVLTLLDQRGRLDHALVVITANHGEELFDHRGFGHGRTLHEEVLRVPLYLKLPGAKTGATVEFPVSLADVPPTLLDLLGLEPTPADGISLAPLLRGEIEAPPQRDFVHELRAQDGRIRKQALLQGRLKLIDTARRRAQLYDLVLDPGEQNDLAPESPEIVERLRAQLETRQTR